MKPANGNIHTLSTFSEQFLSVAGVPFKHILVSEAVPVGAVILMVLCGGSAIFVCGWGPL